MRKFALIPLVIVALSVVTLPIVRAEEGQEKNESQEKVREIKKVNESEQTRLKTTELYQEREQLKENAQQMREKASETTSNAKENTRELEKRALEIRKETEQKKQELAKELRDRKQELEQKASEMRQDLTEEQREHLDRLKSERAAMAEKLQLRIEDAENNAGEMTERLQSKNVYAKLNGAQFSVDDTTNVVTIVTPSGETHELNHLPDQVIARLIEKKALAETEQVSELEIRENETGYEYRTTLQKKKKLLGLFSRDIETEVVVDDTTGEVSETPVPAPSFFGRMLNSLSF